ncbi:hypothetical protein SFRURICE_009317 [Spodoptera frugiperda]|nr:hypothetical protein SFRURICE_009317 [Spodoptera frugiperda]
MVSVHRLVLYASHATDFSLSCIETHTTASTDPHHRQCLNAMRTDDVIRNAYDAGLSVDGCLNNIFLIQSEGRVREIKKESIKGTRPQARIVPPVTDFSLSCIETHTTASTDPYRTHRIISNAYMRCVLMTSYGMHAMRTIRACGRLL